ncbi:MAG: hypothetical protein ACYCXN_12255 [Acidimicrobiales bacterium]
MEEVNVAPLQREKLALPQASHRRRPRQGDVLVSQPPGYLRDLLRRDRRAIALRLLGRP